MLYKIIYNATESKMALKDKNKTAESRETALSDEIQKVRILLKKQTVIQ